MRLSAVAGRMGDRRAVEGFAVMIFDSIRFVSLAIDGWLSGRLSRVFRDSFRGGSNQD
jgi:hypothetical protein